MNMVFCSANGDGLAFMVGENAPEVTMEFFAQGAISQEWAAVLGREYGMDNDLGERLRHRLRGISNPFRVGDCVVGVGFPG